MSDPREAATRSVGELTRHIVERHQLERAAEHDPLDRQIEGEPRFALLGRDVLAPGFVRLYAAIIEGRHGRAANILAAIIQGAKERQQRPHKDTSHAWSARQVADQMEQWHRLNMIGQSPTGRVNVLPVKEDESFRPAPTHAELKAARPPREPGEAE